MTKNNEVKVLIVPMWQDEVSKFIREREYIGKAPVYLTQKCYDSLCKKVQEVYQGKIKTTVCKNSRYNQVLYRLEQLSVLGIDFSYRESSDERIFVFKKAEEAFENCD